ncbi:MAG: hypothetical protein R3281_14580 [Balneolaceae bacterium]|nr:hypothetical protein [Balneolaceae bacterium]
MSIERLGKLVGSGLLAVCEYIMKISAAVSALFVTGITGTFIHKLATGFIAIPSLLYYWPSFTSRLGELGRVIHDYNRLPPEQFQEFHAAGTIENVMVTLDAPVEFVLNVRTNIMEWPLQTLLVSLSVFLVLYSIGLILRFIRKEEITLFGNKLGMSDKRQAEQSPQPSAEGSENHSETEPEPDTHEQAEARLPGTAAEEKRETDQRETNQETASADSRNEQQTQPRRQLNGYTITRYLPADQNGSCWDDHFVIDPEVILEKGAAAEEGRGYNSEDHESTEVTARNQNKTVEKNGRPSQPGLQLVSLEPGNGDGKEGQHGRKIGVGGTQNSGENLESRLSRELEKAHGNGEARSGEKGGNRNKKKYSLEEYLELARSS